MFKTSHCVIMLVTKVWGHSPYTHKEEVLCIYVTKYMTYWTIQWQQRTKTFAFPFFQEMTSRNIPEERKNQLHRWKNLKTRNQKRFSSVARETHLLILLSPYIYIYIYIHIYNTHYSICVVVCTENWKLFMVSIVEENCFRHQINFYLHGSCFITMYFIHKMH
jgi:hypothetical protein